jgi:hypothetical protein
VAGRDVGSLLDEIERDRADQHTSAQAHDQPDYRHADAKAERNECANHERERC